MFLLLRGGFLPGWRRLNTDFPNDYLVASLYRHHIPLDRVYEWDWLQRQNDHLAIPQKEAGFAPHPPTCALPVLPLATMPPLQAKHVWLVTNLGFLIFSIYLLHRVTELGWRRVALVTLLCLFPLQVNFWLGQFYILLLVLLCGSYYAFHSGRQFTCGAILSVAASLKLFPFLFVLLFARRGAWRAAFGLILGVLAIGTISLVLFGLQVHRVYLFQVFPRAVLGDLLSPYSLQWNSFAALWHRLFLFEPELNPAPIWNSVSLYVVAQTVTLTALTFFFFYFGAQEVGGQEKLEWTAFVSLLLLLSPMPAPYHYSLLVFSAVVGIDALLAAGKRNCAMICILLVAFVCAPFPAKLERALVLRRLIGNLLLYSILLYSIRSRAAQIVRLHLRWIGAAVTAAIVVAFCLWTVRGRAEDLVRRAPDFTSAYRSSSPVASGGKTFSVQASRYLDGYRIVAGKGEYQRNLQFAGDALALATDISGSSMYAEESGEGSLIVRLFPLASEHSPEVVTQGQQPVLSSEGRWLAVMRESQGRNAAWLFDLRSGEGPRLILGNQWNPLEVTVLSSGDLIASVGAVSQPYMVLVHRETTEVERLESIRGCTRYPSISPDGQRLAFSRLDSGAWHLIVRELSTGAEWQVTHGSYNAISPSWADSRTILYATDSARGLGTTAVSSITLPN
jgi:Glycosyltransferase family 87/WD40-like Beta Propeller Repeat